jgi:hypothetical protein
MFKKSTFDYLSVSINNPDADEIYIGNLYESWLNLVIVYTGSTSYKFGLYEPDGT